MSHCAKHCKYKLTDLNKEKKLFPATPQGVVAFCEQFRAFPIGTKLKCR